MNYLLDTHAIIWLADNSPKIPPNIKEIVRLSENRKYISSASLWEIAIKMSLGKMTLQVSLDEFLADVEKTEFEILQIENEYLKILPTLPSIHKDPFDRLLISSAIREDLTIITADEDIRKYDVRCIW